MPSSGLPCVSGPDGGPRKDGQGEQGLWWAGVPDVLVHAPPRTACLTPVTVRRVRTACARPCPPTSGPVPPGACCSAAGGTACAVSVRQPARRAWGGNWAPWGTPLLVSSVRAQASSPQPEGKPSLGPLQPQFGRAQGERGQATQPLTCVSPAHPQPSMQVAARRPRATPTWWTAASPPAAP